MIAIAATLLSSAAQAFLDAVAGAISDDLARRLKADPAVVAYKVALAAALQRYSTPERLTLARALTGERSILMSREVAGELSQILRFDREPNYDLIGRTWSGAWLPRSWRGQTARNENASLPAAVAKLRRTARRRSRLKPAMTRRNIDTDTADTTLTCTATSAGGTTGNFVTISCRHHRAERDGQRHAGRWHGLHARHGQ